MKKILPIAILLIAFSFYNCKDTKTKQEDVVIPEQTDTNISQEIDTTIQVSAIVNNDTINESEVVTQTTTTTEITKTISEPVKVESTTKAITKPIIEKNIEVITNTPVETETVTKTEVIVNTPAKTVTEPIVTEKPKTVDKNAWIVPTKYITMNNPIPAKTDASIGKSLYSKHCQS